MKHINRAVSLLSGGLVVFIALLLLLGFVTRNTKTPILWVIEITVYSLVIILYLGLSHCEQERFHVRADVLLVRLPPSPRRVVNIFGDLVALFTMVLISYATGIDAIYSMIAREATQAMIPVPIYPAKIILFTGCVLFSIQLLLTTIGEFREGRIGKVLPTDVS